MILKEEVCCSPSCGSLLGDVQIISILVLSLKNISNETKASLFLCHYLSINTIEYMFCGILI